MYSPINGVVAYIGFAAVANVQVPVVSIALDRVPVSVRAGSDGLVTVTVRFKLSSNPTLQRFLEKNGKPKVSNQQRVFQVSPRSRQKYLENENTENFISASHQLLPPS